MWTGDLPSTSVNFLCHLETFIQHSSAFCVARITCINLFQIFVWLGDFPLTFTSFSYGEKIFCQLFMRLRELPSTSGNFPCSCETFHQLSSTLLNFERHSVNIHQISVWPRDLPSSSINCSCHQKNFRLLPSTYHMGSRPSTNILCS